MSDYLGEFEYLVMLAVAHLQPAAYGVTIRQLLQQRAGRRASLGAVHSTLRRLEAKGLLRSRLGDPEPVRGGKAKKFVTVTPRGRAALQESQGAFQRMAHGLDFLRA